MNIALRDNDLINWKPKNDLHLYYCNCDELVAKENSQLVYLSFIFWGSRNVTCLPLGQFNHFDCAPYVMLLAKIQFDCASGINPCGLNLPQLLSLNKSASTEDLSMLKTAISRNETLDIKPLLANRELASQTDIDIVKTGLLNIYPNPAADLVNIEVSHALSGESYLNLYDM